MKHTSICLAEEMHSKILSTGRPTNTVINEALESYFSGVKVNKDQFQEEIKKYLNSDNMQAFFRNEVKMALIPAISEYMPEYRKRELAKRL